jgi:hypothetical protein
MADYTFSKTFDQSLESVQATAAAREAAKHDRKIRAQRRRIAGAPPQRDMEVFKMAVIEHMTHAEIGRRFGIRRSRVTQIVNDLKRGFAQAAPDDPEIKNHYAQQRLAQALEKMRLEYVLETTAKVLRNPPAALTTRRHGQRDRDGKKEDWEEHVSRQQTLNVQVVKAFLRATEGLRKLNEQAIANTPTQAKRLTSEELLFAIHEVLEEFVIRTSFDAERPSDNFLEMIDRFRANIFHWGLERRKGIPPALAWSGDVTASAATSENTSAGGSLTSLTTPPDQINLDPLPSHAPPGATTSTGATTYVPLPMSMSPPNMAY